MVRRLGKVFLLGVLVGVVLAVVRGLTRPSGSEALPAAPIGRSLSPPGRAPGVAETTSDVRSGPTEPTGSAPGSTRTPAPSAEPAPEADPSGRARAADDSPVIEGDTFVAVEQAPPHDIEVAPAHGLETTWVTPIDGQCPPGYPVKAKVGSNIFHRPGGLSYERTRPDRCYPTPEAAEADGFRAAKR